MQSNVPIHLFDENLNGQLVDASLDYKAEELPDNAKTVQKARLFFAFLKQNIQQVRLLKDFLGIKNVVQMHDTLLKWRESADNKNMAVYFLYPKGEKNCVGCMTVKQTASYVELGGWLTENATGKGYMQEAMRLAEKSLFEKNASEIVRKFYVKNPNKEAVRHSLLKAGYQPCEGKGDEKENKVFQTFHLTKEMYQKIER